MKPTKPSANERALAKLLREMDYSCDGDTWSRAALLARRGVLAVNDKTVPDSEEPKGHRPGCMGWGHHLRVYLRRLARGKP